MAQTAFQPRTTFTGTAPNPNAIPITRERRPHGASPPRFLYPSTLNENVDRRLHGVLYNGEPTTVIRKPLCVPPISDLPIIPPRRQGEAVGAILRSLEGNEENYVRPNHTTTAPSVRVIHKANRIKIPDATIPFPSGKTKEETVLRTYDYSYNPVALHLQAQSKILRQIPTVGQHDRQPNGQKIPAEYDGARPHHNGTQQHDNCSLPQSKRRVRARKVAEIKIDPNVFISGALHSGRRNSDKSRSPELQLPQYRPINSTLQGENTQRREEAIAANYPNTQPREIRLNGAVEARMVRPAKGMIADDGEHEHFRELQSDHRTTMQGIPKLNMERQNLKNLPPNDNTKSNINARSEKHPCSKKRALPSDDTKTTMVSSALKPKPYDVEEVRKYMKTKRRKGTGPPAVPDLSKPLSASEPHDAAPPKGKAYDEQKVRKYMQSKAVQRTHEKRDEIVKQQQARERKRQLLLQLQEFRKRQRESNHARAVSDERNKRVALAQVESESENEVASVDDEIMEGHTAHHDQRGTKKEKLSNGNLSEAVVANSVDPTIMPSFSISQTISTRAETTHMIPQPRRLSPRKARRKSSKSPTRKHTSREHDTTTTISNIPGVQNGKSRLPHTDLLEQLIYKTAELNHRILTKKQELLNTQGENDDGDVTMTDAGDASIAPSRASSSAERKVQHITAKMPQKRDDRPSAKISGGTSPEEDARSELTTSSLERRLDEMLNRQRRYAERRETAEKLQAQMQEYWHNAESIAWLPTTHRSSRSRQLSLNASTPPVQTPPTQIERTSPAADDSSKARTQSRKETLPEKPKNIVVPSTTGIDDSLFNRRPEPSSRPRRYWPSSEETPLPVLDFQAEDVSELESDEYCVARLLQKRDLQDEQVKKTIIEKTEEKIETLKEGKLRRSPSNLLPNVDEVLDVNEIYPDRKTVREGIAGVKPMPVNITPALSSNLSMDLGGLLLGETKPPERVAVQSVNSLPGEKQDDDSLPSDSVPAQPITSATFHSRKGFRKPIKPTVEKNRLSPLSLSQRLHAEITRLNTITDSQVHVVEVEKARELALAQKETVAVVRALLADSKRGVVELEEIHATENENRRTPHAERTVRKEKSDEERETVDDKPSVETIPFISNQASVDYEEDFESISQSRKDDVYSMSENLPGSPSEESKQPSSRTSERDVPSTSVIEEKVFTVSSSENNGSQNLERSTPSGRTSEIGDLDVEDAEYAPSASTNLGPLLEKLRRARSACDVSGMERRARTLDVSKQIAEALKQKREVRLALERQLISEEREINNILDEVLKGAAQRAKSQSSFPSSIPAASYVSPSRQVSDQANKVINPIGLQEQKPATPARESEPDSSVIEQLSKASMGSMSESVEEDIQGTPESEISEHISEALNSHEAASSVRSSSAPSPAAQSDILHTPPSERSEHDVQDASEGTSSLASMVDKLRRVKAALGNDKLERKERKLDMAMKIAERLLVKREERAVWEKKLKREEAKINRVLEAAMRETSIHTDEESVSPTPSDSDLEDSEKDISRKPALKKKEVRIDHSEAVPKKTESQHARTKSIELLLDDEEFQSQYLSHDSDEIEAEIGIDQVEDTTSLIPTESNLDFGDQDETTHDSIEEDILSSKSEAKLATEIDEESILMPSAGSDMQDDRVNEGYEDTFEDLSVQDRSSLIARKGPLGNFAEDERSAEVLEPSVDHRSVKLRIETLKQRIKEQKERARELKIRKLKAKEEALLRKLEAMEKENLQREAESDSSEDHDTSMLTDISVSESQSHHDESATSRKKKKQGIVNRTASSKHHDPTQPPAHRPDTTPTIRIAKASQAETETNISTAIHANTAESRKVEDLRGRTEMSIPDFEYGDESQERVGVSLSEDHPESDVVDDVVAPSDDISEDLHYVENESENLPANDEQLGNLEFDNVPRDTSDLGSDPVVENIPRKDSELGSLAATSAVAVSNEEENIDHDPEFAQDDNESVQEIISGEVQSAISESLPGDKEDDEKEGKNEPAKDDAGNADVESANINENGSYEGSENVVKTHVPLEKTSGAIHVEDSNANLDRNPSDEAEEISEDLENGDVLDTEQSSSKHERGSEVEAQRDAVEDVELVEPEVEAQTDAVEDVDPVYIAYSGIEVEASHVEHHVDDHEESGTRDVPSNYDEDFEDESTDGIVQQTDPDVVPAIYAILAASPGPEDIAEEIEEADMVPGSSDDGPADKDEVFNGADDLSGVDVVPVPDRAIISEAAPTLPDAMPESSRGDLEETEGGFENKPGDISIISSLRTRSTEPLHQTTDASSPIYAEMTSESQKSLSESQEVAIVVDDESQNHSHPSVEMADEESVIEGEEEIAEEICERNSPLQEHVISDSETGHGDHPVPTEIPGSMAEQLAVDDPTDAHSIVTRSLSATMNMEDVDFITNGILNDMLAEAVQVVGEEDVTATNVTDRDAPAPKPSALFDDGAKQQVAPITEAILDTILDDSVKAMAQAQMLASPGLTRESVSKESVRVDRESVERYVDVLLGYLPRKDKYSQPPYLAAHLALQLERAQTPRVSDAQRIRHRLIFDAVNEAIGIVFKQEEEKARLRPTLTSGRPVIASRIPNWLFSEPSHPIDIPKDIIQSQVRKLVVEDWGVYMHVHGEKLDAALIKEVKEEEKTWANQTKDVVTIREQVSSMIWEDLLTDTIQTLDMIMPAST